MNFEKSNLAGRREIVDGVAEYEGERFKAEVLAGGNERRVAYIPDTAEARHATEQWRRWKAIKSGVPQEKKENYRGAWEAHFREHIEHLDFESLAKEAESSYVNLLQDVSMIQEYRLLLKEICARVLSGENIENLQNYRESGSKISGLRFTYRDSIIELPNSFHAAGGTIHCDTLTLGTAAVYCEDERWSQRRAVIKDIVAGPDIEDSFAKVLRSEGYEDQNAVGLLHELPSLLDMDVVAQAIRNIDNYEQVQYDNFVPRDNFVQRGAPVHDFLPSLVENLRSASTQEQIRISENLGELIGRIAARTTYPSREEALFLIKSGLLSTESISSACAEKLAITREKWHGIDINLDRDLRVFAIYDAIMPMTFADLSLDNRVQIAEYLEKSGMSLDMTRGNDPTIETSGCLSGVTPEMDAGYDHGIYLGVNGAFFDWGSANRTVVRQVPLANVDQIGQAIIFGKALKGPVEQIRDGLYVLDGQHSSVNPYDPPDTDVHSNFIFDLTVSPNTFGTFKRFYPEVRAVEKDVRVRCQNVVRTIRLPFIELPEYAADNLKKVSLIAEATGSKNFFIKPVIREMKDLS